MKRDIFIGGAWPYANYYLHVGHLASLLPGDVLAKYYRGKGDNVIYVSGSDCHGTPITERARKEGKTPEEIAGFYHDEFVKTFTNLGFEYDLYTNTMTDYHSNYVQKQFLRLKENGWIYEKDEPAVFCEKCNKFLSDREIIGKCPNCGGVSTGDQCDECLTSLDSEEVLDKHCKICGSETVTRDNKHLYFKLTAFEDELQDLIKNNSSLWRKNAIGEAQKYIDTGLRDRAATRQLDWGIPVPVEGFEDKRIYVWIEAVMGYLSAGQKVADERGIDFDKYLSNDNKNLRTYYVHGKDNIPFHTTIFPALVSGLQYNYRLPDYIVSCAFVNLNDEKMSKSKGTLLTANELLERFPKDTLRFYFTYLGPETHDTNCSVEELIQCHNKFLVGQLGNFVNRNLGFINKKFDGVITEGEIDKEVRKATKEAYKSIGEAIERGEFRNALSQILEYISNANKYYDSNEPWVKVKNEDLTEFNNVTYTCVYMMANIANLIKPFMPDASDKIKDMLSFADYKWDEEVIKGNITIKNFDMLYNRIDE